MGKEKRRKRKDIDPRGEEESEGPGKRSNGISKSKEMHDRHKIRHARTRIWG